VPAGVGSMAAIMKMPTDQLEALCRKHSTAGMSVELANYNSDAQLVIAGHKAAVQALCAEAGTLGARCIELAVSAPFHSSLMRPARDFMEPLLLESSFIQNDTVMIPNINALEVKDYGPRYLIEQIDGPVRWIQSIEQAKNLGLTRFLEIGPGKVLNGLVKRIVPKDGFIIQSTDEIEETIASLKRAP